MGRAAKTGAGQRHRARTPGNVALPELLAGACVSLLHQAAIPLEDGRKRPTSDDTVYYPVAVAADPLALSKGQLVDTNHVKHPTGVERSWSVVVPQVEW